MPTLWAAIHGGEIDLAEPAEWSEGSDTLGLIAVADGA